jgi:hypothetical protein
VVLPESLPDVVLPESLPEVVLPESLPESWACAGPAATTRPAAPRSPLTIAARMNFLLGPSVDMLTAISPR